MSEETIEHDGTRVELDDDGYLARFDDWSPEVACTLAAQEDVDGPPKPAPGIVTHMRRYPPAEVN